MLLSALFRAALDFLSPLELLPFMELKGKGQARSRSFASNGD
jgi:hypothetical protein